MVRERPKRAEREILRGKGKKERIEILERGKMNFLFKGEILSNTWGKTSEGVFQFFKIKIDNMYFIK